MKREKFVTFRSGAVPLAAANVDTDQIIPARFLKAVERKGFGDNLFRDWRYESDGSIVSEFPLNDKRYDGKILLAGDNFGSGSSREHAAWAIYDYGFRVVVSSSFADIFRNNALNNGILLVQVDEEFLNGSFASVAENPAALFEVNLEEQTIANIAAGSVAGFTIDAYKKECLLNGYDDVDYLRSIASEIEKYEESVRHDIE